MSSIVIGLSFLLIISLIGWLVYKKQRKIAVLLSVICLSVAVIVGISFFQTMTGAEKKVSSYFNYFEATFQLTDDQSVYDRSGTNRNDPRIRLEFQKYDQSWLIQNEVVTSGTAEKAGIEALRRHIYPHYAAYILKEFIYNQAIGNEFAVVESYLEDKGYNYHWDKEVYFSEDKQALYSDESELSNLKLPSDTNEIKLKDEKAYYSGKSVQQIDFLQFIDFFDYQIHLVGVITKKEPDSADIEVTQLNELLEQTIKHQRLKISLKEATGE